MKRERKMRDDEDTMQLLLKRIEVLGNAYAHSERTRRKLQTELQRIQGPVQLFCRIYPTKDEKSCVRHVAGTDNILVEVRDKSKRFRFDAVQHVGTGRQHITRTSSRALRRRGSESRSLSCYGEHGPERLRWMSCLSVALRPGG